MSYSNELKTNWRQICDLVGKKAEQCGRRPDDIRIIAVSKTHPAETVKAAIEAGINLFGENYAQEFSEKQAQISDEGLNPEWHFIGHLQTNKVKLVVPYVSLIHSVDSVRLAEEIDKQAEKENKTSEILLQVNTSGEFSKSGTNPENAIALYEEVSKLKSIRIKGLMTIGSFSPYEEVYRKEFRSLVKIRDEIRRNYNDADLSELSMGMSGDFETAIEEGATMVRIGTAIFGARDYSV